MLRRAALALAFVLFLVPGNLVAGALQAWAGNCDGQKCCCPEPERQDSNPSLERACCCEAQPAQAPADRPDEPVQLQKQLPTEALASLGGDAMPALRPLGGRTCAWIESRAQAPPDPLYLRYQSLRL